MKYGGLLIAAGVLGAFGLVSGCSVVSFNNSLVEQEQGITATWQASQLEYDNFWKKVKETAQVTDAYADDFRDIFLGSMEARYDGKDPAFSFIMESNPQLDSSTYVKVQNVIEAGRNKFTRSQATLVDKQRRYRTDLGKFPNNMVANFLDFPKGLNGDLAPAIDTDNDGKTSVLDYKIITSAKTAETFATGREDEALDVFNRGD